MNDTRDTTRTTQPVPARPLTVIALLVSAVGIAVLWATGQPFPFYPPPGIIILVVSSLLVALLRYRWAPVIGAAVGIFLVGGFLISGLASGAGFDNLSGAVGAGRLVGQAIQLIGALGAIVAGFTAAAGRPRAAAAEISR